MCLFVPYCDMSLEVKSQRGVYGLNIFYCQMLIKEYKTKAVKALVTHIFIDSIKWSDQGTAQMCTQNAVHFSVTVKYFKLLFNDR